MMKNYVSILSVITLLLLSGCDILTPSEDEPLLDHISGQAINVNTQEGVADALIKVRMKGAETSWKWEWIDSTMTDEDGYFDMSYMIPDETTRLVAKGFKDGHFELTDDIPAFTYSRDSTIVGMYPKTYLRIRIEDEYPYDYSKYVGIQLSHTTFVPNDTFYQYPLDTTVIIAANPIKTNNGYNSLGYSLVYDRPNTVGSLNIIPQVSCPQFDTCDITIRL